MLSLLVLVLAGCTSGDKSSVDDTGPGDTSESDCANPDAAEICDGVDNDCDGVVDEDATDPGTWYTDADHDGFGDGATAVEGCEKPTGTVTDGTDCDDTNVAVSPGATEVCDGLDNDCDELTDDEDPTLRDAGTWYPDADFDGFGDGTGGAAACDAPAGTVADGTDCDDTVFAVNPGAAEVCDDGVDNNCDLSTDEGCGGEDTGGEDTGPGDTGGEDTGGEDTGPGDTSGEDTGGEDTGGEDSGGEDSGGEDTVVDSGGDDSGTVDSGVVVDVSVCGGTNTEDTFQDKYSTGGPDLLIGMAYTSDADTEIGRLEVFTGEGAGTNTVSLWTDDGGFPGVELASGAWDMSRENGWQGADLDTCVPVTAGTNYWVVWGPVNGAQSSLDASGTTGSYSGSFDGGSVWTGPYSGFVKFRLSCCE